MSASGDAMAMFGMPLADDQIKVLEENFTKVTKHPDETTLMLIAAECGLSEEETAVSLAGDPRLRANDATRCATAGTVESRATFIGRLGALQFCRVFLIGRIGSRFFALPLTLKK